MAGFEKTPEILIVEDDATINGLIKEALTKHGCNCTQAFSGTEGLLVFKSKKFDLVILDLMMPGMSGEELLASMRKESHVPAIVVSAKGDTDTRIDLLKSGADDFLVKPFEVKELIARVDVQLRHKAEGYGASDDSVKLHFKDLTLDSEKYEVCVGDTPVVLTRQEFKILELFMKYPTKVFSKQQIYEYAWNDFYIGEDKTINVHISNIRSKLKKISNEEYIETVWGIGFRLMKQ